MTKNNSMFLIPAYVQLLALLDYIIWHICVRNQKLLNFYCKQNPFPASVPHLSKIVHVKHKHNDKHEILFFFVYCFGVMGGGGDILDENLLNNFVLHRNDDDVLGLLVIIWGFNKALLIFF